MRIYETLIISDSSLSPSAGEDLFKKIEAIVVKYKGSIKKRQDLGRKSLGYMIRKKSSGNISILYVESDASKVDFIEKELALVNEILRFTMFRVDAVPAEAKAPAKTEEEAVKV